MSCPKQNGPPFGGPFVVEFRGLISWPVRAPGLAQEPVRAQGLVLEQAPGLVREQARVLAQVREPVRRASSAQPVRAQARVCWRPAVRRAPRGVRRFFRKHSRRRWPG